MKKIIDIMTDLETLDKYNSPVITQISAVPFQLETGEIYEGNFDEFISPMSGVAAGLDIGGETVKWWLTQEKDAIEKVLVKSIILGKDLKEVLLSFNKYINDTKKAHNADEVRIYGNGVLSDIKWLESAYQAVGVVPAWNFREPSCVRSLVETGKRFFGVDPKSTLEFKGIKHNAIDDCKHQIEYCCAIAKVMVSSKKALDSKKKKK